MAAGRGVGAGWGKARWDEEAHPDKHKGGCGLVLPLLNGSQTRVLLGLLESSVQVSEKIENIAPFIFLPHWMSTLPRPPGHL